MKAPRWDRVALGTALAIAVLYFADHVVSIPYMFGYEYTTLREIASQDEFNSTVWKRAERTNDPIRLKMVDSLLRRHRLVGMSRSDVAALLGVPESTSYFRDYDYVYWLGPERGPISIDSEWLCLKFENDKVVKAVVLRD